MKKPEEYKGKFAGENHPFYGKTHSEETRRKQSEAKKGKNNPNYGKSHSEEYKRNLKEENGGTTEKETINVQ